MSRFSLGLMLLFILSIINSNAVYLPHSVCQNITKVVVYYRDYYSLYLGRNSSSGELNKDGLYYLSIKDSVENCCPNASLEFVFQNTTEDELELVALLKTELNRGSPHNFSFYFPEFAEAKEKAVYDFQLRFIRLSRSPGQALVMLNPPLRRNVFLFEIFEESVPILLLMLTLSWAVGILGWMADHWKNPAEFPSPFIIGIFDGFWWSIVTMTTVGYGDKSPKSIPARILAVFWILISAILLSLFTANATTILNIRQQPVDYSKTIGKRIGVIQSKNFDDFQLNLGAHFINYQNYSSLFDALKTKKIERFLFPNYKDLLVYHSMEKYKDVASLFKIVNTFQSPFQIGMVLALGPKKISADDELFLTCLQTSITLTEKVRTKRLSNDVDIAFDAIESDKSITILNHEGFNQLSYYTLIVIAVLIFFGLIWDLWKCTTRKKNEQELELDNNELGETNGTVARIRDEATWL